MGTVKSIHGNRLNWQENKEDKTTLVPQAEQFNIRNLEVLEWLQI